MARTSFTVSPFRCPQQRSLADSARMQASSFFVHVDGQDSDVRHMHGRALRNYFCDRRLGICTFCTTPKGSPVASWSILGAQSWDIVTSLRPMYTMELPGAFGTHASSQDSPDISHGLQEYPPELPKFPIIEGLNIP